MHYALTQVPITLAFKIVRCDSDRGNLCGRVSAGSPRLRLIEHLSPHAKYISWWAAIMEIDYFVYE